jgi:WD40 repeat protein
LYSYGDWKTGALISKHRVAQSPITALAYTADGGQLVVLSGGNSMRIFDAETLASVRAPLSLNRYVNRVFTSPDNRTAIALTATPSSAGFALVDLVDGRVLHQGSVADDFAMSASFPGGVPFYADFSPDGQRVAVSYTDRVGVLDTETGEWIRPPVDSHEGPVASLAYAPDGEIVASGGSDGRVGLWDGRTGALLGTVLPGQPNTPLTAEFLADGHTLQIASFNGAIYTWDTRPQHWVKYACTVVGRNLTKAEWRDTFGDRRYHRTCPDYPAGE